MIFFFNGKMIFIFNFSTFAIIKKEREKKERKIRRKKDCIHKSLVAQWLEHPTGVSSAKG